INDHVYCMTDNHLYHYDLQLRDRHSFPTRRSSDLKFDGPNEQFSPWFLVKKGFQKNPQFDPNEGYYYSNTNYIILGLIIEKVTGKSLKKVMNKRLFEPIGMEKI